MKIRAFLIGVAVFLAATITPSLQAEIIGVEQFDYPDGPIAGQRGGTFWDWQNRLTPAPGPRHTGRPSDWENFNLVSSVASGRLMTDNTNFRREYNGLIGGAGGVIETDEGYGAINNFNGNGLSFREHVVYYRATLTTGAAVPQSITISSSDFGTERVAFGVTANNGSDLRFSIRNQLGIILSGSVSAAPNKTYLLVAKLDFVNGLARLYLDPDLNAAESSQTPLVSLAFDPTFWSSSVQLGSGTGGSVTWDDLVVATTWDELGTVVTTTADEDDISLIPGINNGSGGTGVSLREAVKYSPAGSLITFDSSLSGKTITLGGTEFEVTKTLTIDGSALSMGVTIDANRASRHFFIFDSPSSSLTLKALTLINGNGSDLAGSIRLETGNLFLQRCTLSGNFAGDAGAISMQGTSNSRLEECTLTGNRSTASEGNGGIAVFDGICTLSRCTISGNTGKGGGGGLYLQSPGSVSLSNCLIAGNTDSAANDIFRGSGNLTASGNNLIGSNATVSTTFLQGPLVGTPSAPLDPKLSPLGYFGGPTQTMHPLIGSPAIDAGGTTNPGGTDQRGFPRFVDGDFNSSGAQLDIGAVEAGPLFTVSFNSDVIGGGGQLRDRITSAAGFAGGRIGFSNSNFPSQSITLNGTELTIPATANGLFIDASNLSGPVTISGGNASRVFNIAAGATVAMHSLVATEGKSLNGGGQASSGQDGGGLLNDGSLSLFSCSITNNRSGNGSDGFSVFPGNGGNGGFGGGIDNRGRLSLTACNVSGNATGDGGDNGSGGPGGGISSTGPLSLTACTLANNVTGKAGNAASGSGGNGGAISCSVSYRLTACTIAVNFTGNGGTDGSSNGAAGSGAGISGGNAILQHCLIANNGTLSGVADDVNVGSVTFLNANLLGTTATGSATGPAPIIAADAGLTPLANNGGPTQTIALLAGSPAINAATGSTATSDQRGFPIVGVADIGAFEGQIGSVPSLTTSEDTPVTSASFPAGLVGTVSASSSAPSLVAPANIVLTTNGTNGTLQITPAANANGNATITLLDNFGAQQTFSITVNAVNDAPTFTAGPNVSVLNTAGAQTVSAWATAISPGPADESAQTLTFSLDATNAGLFSVLPTLTAAGTLSFTPAPGAVGTSTIAVRLRDNGGTSNGGIDQSAAQNFTITFTATPPPAPLTRLIRVRANVSSRGTVSGGKRYVNNSFATVRARARSGFKFVKWTEGKRTVSTKASYRFKVTKNRSLVANFVKR